MERNSTTTRHRHLPVAEGRPARRLRRRRRWGAAAVLTSFAGVVAACGPDEPSVTAERSVRLAAVEEDDSQGSTPPSDVGAGVADPTTASGSTSTTVVPAPPPGSAAPAVTLPEDLPPATLSTALVPPPAPPPVRSLQDLMITVDDLPEGWTPVYTSSEFRPSSAMAAAGWPGARATQEPEQDCFRMAQADVIPPIDFSADALFRSPAEDEWTATYLQFRAGRTSGLLEAVLLEMRLLACDGAPMPGGGTYEMIQLPPLELGDAATAIFLRAHSPIYTSDRVLTIVQVGDVIFTGTYSTNMEDNLGEVHLLDESLRLLIDRLANA